MTSFSEADNIPQENPNLMTPGSLAQISQDLQRSVQADLTGIRAETEQLRGRSNFVIGMLIAFVLIMTGVSAWLTIRILSFKQVPNTSNINTELSETELLPRLDTLEQELKTLKKFDSSTLTDEVQNNQEQLQKVVQQVKRLSGEMQALQGTNESPNATNGRTSPVPDVQPQPTPSEPAPSAQPKSLP